MPFTCPSAGCYLEPDALLQCLDWGALAHILRAFVGGRGRIGHTEATMALSPPRRQPDLMRSASRNSMGSTALRQLFPRSDRDSQGPPPTLPSLAPWHSRDARNRHAADARSSSRDAPGKSVKRRGAARSNGGGGGGTDGMRASVEALPSVGSAGDPAGVHMLPGPSLARQQDDPLYAEQVAYEQEERRRRRSWLIQEELARQSFMDEEELAQAARLYTAEVQRRASASAHSRVGTARSRAPTANAHPGSAATARRPKPGIGGVVPPGVVFGKQRGAQPRRSVPTMYGPGMSFVQKADAATVSDHPVMKHPQLLVGARRGRALRTLAPPPLPSEELALRRSVQTAESVKRAATAGLRRSRRRVAPNAMLSSTQPLPHSSGSPLRTSRSAASLGTAKHRATSVKPRRFVGGQRGVGTSTKASLERGLAASACTEQMPDRDPKPWQKPVPIFSVDFREEMERMQALWASVPKRKYLKAQPYTLAPGHQPRVSNVPPQAVAQQVSAATANTLDSFPRTLSTQTSDVSVGADVPRRFVMGDTAISAFKQTDDMPPVATTILTGPLGELSQEHSEYTVNSLDHGEGGGHSDGDSDERVDGDTTRGVFEATAVPTTSPLPHSPPPHGATVDVGQRHPAVTRRQLRWSPKPPQLSATIQRGGVDRNAAPRVPATPEDAEPASSPTLTITHTELPAKARRLLDPYADDAVSDDGVAATGFFSVQAGARYAPAHHAGMCVSVAMTRRGVERPGFNRGQVRTLLTKSWWPSTPCPSGTRSGRTRCTQSR